MFYLGLIGLVMPLIGLVLIAWAILTVIRAVTLPKGATRTPACERCKYSVADLAGFTCPECGTDLRKTGIITPAMEAARRGSTAGAILAWTFLFLAGIYFTFIIGFMFIGAASFRTATAVSTWSQTLTPMQTTGYLSVELAYDSDLQSLAGPMDITITLDDGSTHLLVLDPGPMQITGMQTGTTAWNSGVIDTWFGELGLDTTDPNVAAAAAEVGRAIDVTTVSPSTVYSMALSEHFSSVNTGGAIPSSLATGTVFDSRVFWLVAFGAGIVVYVGGIVFIVRRRRKMLVAIQ